MKKALAGIAVTVLALMAQTTTAAAQDYSGTDPDEGVFVASGPVDAGDQIGFQATNLDNGTYDIVLVFADGTTRVLQSVSVSGGFANLNFSLPADLAGGTYTINVQQQGAPSGGFVSSLTVTLGESIATTGSGGSSGGGDTLAVTGANTPSLIGVGSALALLGAGFVLVSRRKRAADLISID